MFLIYFILEVGHCQFFPILFIDPVILINNHRSWYRDTGIPDTHTRSRSSFSSGLVTSRSSKNSGTAALMVKYISNFRLVFSKENLQPRRKVMIRWSSARGKEKIPCMSTKVKCTSPYLCVRPSIIF